jgi:hypothetical protein
MASILSVIGTEYLGASCLEKLKHFLECCFSRDCFDVQTYDALVSVAYRQNSTLPEVKFKLLQGSEDFNCFFELCFQLARITSQIRYFLQKTPTSVLLTEDSFEDQLILEYSRTLIDLVSSLNFVLSEIFNKYWAWLPDNIRDCFLFYYSKSDISYQGFSPEFCGSDVVTERYVRSFDSLRSSVLQYFSDDTLKRKLAFVNDIFQTSGLNLDTSDQNSFSVTPLKIKRSSLEKLSINDFPECSTHTEIGWGTPIGNEFY